MLEIRLHQRLAVVRQPPVHMILAMVGEQPGHGNQGEACIPFLFHAALALPMKVLNLHQPFGYLVPFLDAPSRVIQIRQLLDGILVPVQQGRAQDEDGIAHGILHQPQAVRAEGGSGVPSA